MRPHTEFALQTLADRYGLTVQYFGEMPTSLAGFLAPPESPHTIVINAKMPKFEQAFTIAHEIAHYILHYEGSHRMRLPWYLRRRWKSKPMVLFSKATKRMVYHNFHNENQSDLWAFSTLLQLRATDDIQAILAEHPEKTWLFYLAAGGSIYLGLKCPFEKALHSLMAVFSLLSTTGS